MVTLWKKYCAVDTQVWDNKSLNPKSFINLRDSCKNSISFCTVKLSLRDALGSIIKILTE